MTATAMGTTRIGLLGLKGGTVDETVTRHPAEPVAG